MKLPSLAVALALTLAVVAVSFAPAVARAQAAATPAPKPLVVLRAARMLDVKRGKLVKNAVIVIAGDRIRAAGEGIAVPDGANVIDLGDVTLLPWLIDCHTHLMARIPDDDNGYLVSLATKSQAYRALEGAANARLTLQAGYTTVRDVENEGSGYADVALRDAIAEGLVEGPRMFVATRGIASVGQYNPFGVAPDLAGFPTGAQMVSGVEEARRAAREQLGHGADLLKVYADWANATLTVEELRVVVDEAHRARKKVAAHAGTPDGIRNALAAGVDSIEHGNELDRTLLGALKAKGVFWVTTRAAYGEALAKEKRPQARKFIESVVARGRANIGLARQLGVKIAAGYDTASAESQGHNVNEVLELNRLGLTPLEAIRAATTSAAELLGRADQLGSLEPGHFADVIAVAGDPLADLGTLARVKLVMKDGAVVRRDR